MAATEEFRALGGARDGGVASTPAARLITEFPGFPTGVPPLFFSGATGGAVSKSVLPPIPNRYLAEGEPGSGGLWRLDAEERVARRARLPNKGMFYRNERRAYFNEKLQADQWVAFGRSPKLGKRVPIDSPWRELHFDDLGNMWDDGERFTDVRFYHLADHTKIGVDADASSFTGKAEQPEAKPGGDKPRSGKRGGYDSTLDEIMRGVELARSGLSNTRAAEVLFERLHPKPVEREQLNIWIDKQRRFIRRMRKKIGDAIKTGHPS